MVNHIDKSNNPIMLDVGNKTITERTAVAEGEIIFDKNTCAYSIYDNGWTSDPKIKSVSIVGRQADVNTDNWTDLEVNGLQCNV